MKYETLIELIKENSELFAEVLQATEDGSDRIFIKQTGDTVNIEVRTIDKHSACMSAEKLLNLYEDVMSDQFKVVNTAGVFTIVNGKGNEVATVPYLGSPFTLEFAEKTAEFIAKHLNEQA